MLKNGHALLLSMLAFAGFSATNFFGTDSFTAKPVEPVVPGRVVISAPILATIYGGDRFLAANFESIRVAATASDYNLFDTDYILRAQQVASELNPCHEDNYYLSHAFLTWGGAEEYSSKVLSQAIKCRFWDEVPAFYYGFNQFFFHHDIVSAQQSLELAATRSKENAAAYKKLAIMLEIETIQDERLALNQLILERDKARDPKLRSMLDKRATRLSGLLLLRDAHRRYEKQTGRQLQQLEELVDSGVIDAIPADPMRLGYEVGQGHIVLRRMKILGMENP